MIHIYFTDHPDDEILELVFFDEKIKHRRFIFDEIHVS